MQWLTQGEWDCIFNNGPKLAVENPNGRYKKISPINIYQPVGYCNWFMRQMEDDQEKQTEGLLHEKGEKEKSIEDSKQNWKNYNYNFSHASRYKFK